MAEILDFCYFVSPTQEEQASRVAAVQRVSEVVKYIWPHCKVRVSSCCYLLGLHVILDLGFDWLVCDHDLSSAAL